MSRHADEDVWLRLAAAQHSTAALLRLAEIAEDESECDTDASACSAAAQYARLALVSPQFAYHLARCLLRGKGVDVDFGAAKEQLERVFAAQVAGDYVQSEAFSLLGECYEHGKGVPIDIERADELFKQGPADDYAMFLMRRGAYADSAAILRATATRPASLGGVVFAVARRGFSRSTAASGSARAPKPPAPLALFVARSHALAQRAQGRGVEAVCYVTHEELCDAECLWVPPCGHCIAACPRTDQTTCGVCRAPTAWTRVQFDAPSSTDVSTQAAAAP